MDLVHVRELVPAADHEWRPGDAYLAGGTWLFSEPQPTVHRLLDLHSFGWAPLTVAADGLTIAATCTLEQLAAWKPPGDWAAGGLFRQCCDALLGSFKVWYSATVGGNVCCALPAGPMTSLCASLSAVATVWDVHGGDRQVPVTDFVLGPGRNALSPGELLRSLFVPAEALRCRTAFRQLSLSPYGRSAVVVIGRREERELVLTVTASTPHPVQVRVLAESVDTAVDSVLAAVPAWHDDVHGDPRWRAAMTARLVAEVVAELVGSSEVAGSN